jgi:hypothetical protein
MSNTLGTFKGKPIDENMSKAELLEVIRYTSESYKSEREYNLKIEKALPVDWQLRVLEATNERD